MNTAGHRCVRPIVPIPHRSQEATYLQKSQENEKQYLLWKQAHWGEIVEVDLAAAMLLFATKLLSSINIIDQTRWTWNPNSLGSLHDQTKQITSNLRLFAG